MATYQFRITDADGKLVESKGGFKTPQDALVAGSQYLRTLAFSPDYIPDRIYSIATKPEFENQQKSSN